MKRTTIRVLSALFVLVLTLSSLCFPAAALSTIKYDCDNTVTMKVRTGNADARMVFKCNAKTYSDSFGVGIFRSVKKHTCSVAPKMVLKVSPKVYGKEYYFIQGTGKSISSTLKLSRNMTYTIKVYYLLDKCNECSAGNWIWYHNKVGGATAYSDGMWSVTSTKNVSSITVTSVK